MLTDTKVAAIKPPKSGQQEHRDTKVTGLRLRVGTSGKKSWTVRARAGDKVINRKIGTYPTMRLAEARKAAQKLLDAIAKDGSTESADRTFGVLAAAWLDKKRKDATRNKSLNQQERRLELHVLPKWRDRKLVEIKRGDVRDLVESIEGDVLPNRVLTVIRTIFRYALTRDWLDASPAEGVEKPKSEKPRDRFLDMDEVKQVWEASVLMGFPFGSFIRALMLTGQRRGEVASMRWEDVNLDDATWMLKASDTKGERAHLVPLSVPMVDLLSDLPKLGGYVFTTSGDVPINGFAKAKRRLDEYVAANGKAVDDWTLHDLRRTASSHMARLGINSDIRGRVLNHAVQGVTDRHYTPYDFAAEKKHALDRWAAELMRVVRREDAAKVVPIRG